MVSIMLLLRSIIKTKTSLAYPELGLIESSSISFQAIGELLILASSFVYSHLNLKNSHEGVILTLFKWVFEVN